MTRKKTWYLGEKDFYSIIMGFNTSGLSLSARVVGPLGIYRSYNNAEITVDDTETGTVRFLLDLSTVTGWNNNNGGNLNNFSPGHFILQAWGNNASIVKYGAPEDAYIKNAPWVSWRTSEDHAPEAPPDSP
jgi:hypothetical protein